jgi:hypothetical protein
MEAWNAPYMRTRVNQDDPLYPRTGTLSQCPDIIPNGTDIKKKPEEFISDGQWNSNLGTSTTAKRSNFLYIRGMNPSAQATRASVYLYYSPARLLQWPNTVDKVEGWATRPLRTGDHREYQEVAIAGKSRFVTPDAFEWVPKSLPGDHYCLVARVSTDKYPNPIPEDLEKIDDFALYISKHPDLGWRNVDLLEPKDNAWVSTQEYNQGVQGAEMVISLFVTNGRKGDYLTAVSSVDGPNPPIDMRLNLVGSKDKEQVNLRTFVPDKYRTNIVVTYVAASGQPIPDNLGIVIDPLRVGIRPDSELAPYAKPLRSLGITSIENAEEYAIPMGSMTYLRDLPSATATILG